MGSLTGALSSAVSGLRSTQTQMEIISGNVANSGTTGYSRRQATLLETGGNGTAGGVRVAGVQRLLDTILQRELRTETAGSGYSAIKASYTDQIQKLLGTPGSSGALDGTFNTFTKSLQALSSNPSDSVLRASAVTAAQTLAQRLNSISNGIQDLRNNTEMALSADVSRANDLLNVIASTDIKIAGDLGRDPALLDQRDAAINELSKLMDLRVTQNGNGTVSIATEGGMRLYENGQAANLSFDARGNLGPNALYASGTARGVGTITIRDGQGNTIDAIGQKLIRSGEIAALIDMRDTVLVQAQDQLDEMAAALARAVSDTTVTSTATTGLSAPNAGLDLDISGLQAGNVVTVDTTASPGGAAQRFSFMRSDNAATTLTNAATADPNDIVVKLDYSSATPIATQVQNALPPGFTVSVSGNTLRIVYDTTSGPQLTGLSASVTNTALTDNGKEMPLFVDGATGKAFTGSMDGATQKLGFAARIAVNPQVTADPSLLVRSATGSNATLAGDPARPTLLYDRLTKATTTFSASTGIGQGSAPFTGTVGEFMTRAIEAQASNATAAKSMDDGQKVVQASIESRFALTSGVNVDTEMANLIQVQNAYAANARIVSAVKDMFDLLMRM